MVAYREGDSVLHAVVNIEVDKAVTRSCDLSKYNSCRTMMTKLIK